MSDTAKIIQCLESRGWLRAVAGDTDFTAAVSAVATALDAGLGLLVSGAYGVGKTRLAEAVGRGLGPFRKVRLGIPEDLVMFSNDWMAYCAENLFRENVLLDDVGAENPRNEFGVRIEPVLDFINRWHELHAPGTRLLVTTNLTAKEIDARYGGRFYSRLKDLCVPLLLAGKDKRHWTLPTKGGAE